MASSRYPHLTWQQTNLGHWEREIDEAERFYMCLAKSYEGSGRMYFAITGFAHISVEIEDDSAAHIGQNLEDALRYAWLRLRYDHPTIASHTFYDEYQQKWKKRYTPFHPNDIESHTEEWLEQTFLPISPGWTGLEWCNADPIAPELPTLFVITSPNASEDDGMLRRDVVIRSPHDIMDGIGTLQILSKLFKVAAHLYAQPPSSWSPPPSWTPPLPPGSETWNLSAPLRVAAAISPILTLAQQELLQNLITENEALRKNVEILSVPFKEGALIPGRHQRIETALTVSDTARLLGACKSIGATVTHVHHAAIAIAIRDLQKPGTEPRPARCISHTLINERPNCTGEYAASKHAATVYHTISGPSLALDFTIPSLTELGTITKDQRQDEFTNLAEQVKSYYHRIRDSPDSLALAPSCWSMATPHIADPTATETPVPAPNSTPSVGISSMGVIDRIISPRYGALEIDNPWVSGEELGTGFGVFLGSWEGSLKVSAVFNDAWHDGEEVEAFLRRVRGVVWKGLGLDE